MPQPDPSTQQTPHIGTGQLRAGLGAETHRFGQGIHVDRLRPHVFHRDYWPLRVIRDEVAAFARRHAGELAGRTVLDFGAGVSPYAPLLEKVGAKVLRADLEPVYENDLRIGDDGRVPLGDGSVRAVISTQVLEHVPDVAPYLAEAHRLIEPGGLLFLSTHGAFIRHGAPSDYRRWMTDGLRHELRQAGFVVESVTPRIGILATSSHLRSITFGGVTHRIPGAGWLRPLIYLFFNARMAVEEMVTPASVMDAQPELLFAVARKRG